MATIILDTRSAEAKKMLEFLKSTRYAKVIEEKKVNDETISAINDIENGKVNSYNSVNDLMLSLKKKASVYTPTPHIITDAAQMLRAVMHFRNAGLQPIPAPTNFIIRKNNIPHSYTYYFPSSGNIRNMEIVIQEYLGMLWAKMGGD